ncbi:MAG: MoxR family ATPase, partial [Polyangiaceae bacterium]
MTEQRSPAPPSSSPLLSTAPVDDVALLAAALQAGERLRKAIGQVVVGQEDVLEAMLVTLLARGHALLVGVPGLAKTLLVSSLAQALDLDFGRIQFTPDLLPADITGTDVLQESDGDRKLSFLPGPLFHNIILGDEINRTPPKTQAALLQAMQEREVTMGVNTHSLPTPFQVFATRNPIEQEGTYPLPEAQRDRFMLEIVVNYPSEAEELEIAARSTSELTTPITSVVSREQLLAICELVPRVPITQEAIAYAVAATRRTRPEDEEAPEAVRQFVRYGAGPRGSQSLVLAAKSRAVLGGRAAADMDDIHAMLAPTLRHR